MPDKKGGDHFADQEYLKLMDVVSDGIAVYERRKEGKEFIIRDFNRSAERIEKIKRADILGKSVEDVFPGIKEMGLLSVFERVWRTGKSEKLPLVTYKDKRISGWRENEVVKLKSGFIAAIYSDMTKDKQAEEALIIARKKCDTITDSLVDPIMVIDLKFRIQSANKSAFDIVAASGMNLADQIGKSIFNLSPILDRKTTQKDYEEVIATGKPIERDAIYKIGSGVIFSKTRRLPMFSEGKVVGILIVSHNMTKEKVTEKKLKESIERFETVAKTAGEWIWSLDPMGIFTYSSTAVRPILGFSPEEIVGKSGFDILDPESVEKMDKLWKSIVKKKEEFRRLFVVALNKKGEKVFLELSAVPVFDEEGTFVGYSGVASDITDRQSYEENLQKFQLAVENASDHIVITDREGIILYANKAASDNTGYSMSEMIGKKPSLWGKQMSLEFYSDMWHRIKDLKETFIGEFTNKKKNGETYVAEAKISPILSPEGEARFFVGIERDVTKAKEVDRVKTEFVSLASHQLRTPLSIINWYTEALLNGDKGPITEPQRDYITEIHHSNHRMIELVNALLNTSRIDMGTLMVVPKPIRLLEISDEVISELGPQIKKKEITIEKDYDNLPVLNADPDLVRIIFQNIISNAVKYTGNKGEVSIKMEKTDKDAVITISDNGCGIPISAQNKIFTKLFRADNARALDPDGTGLGLYIVKSIITVAGGDIRFKSSEGKGTTFIFKLPLSGMKPREGTKGLN